MMFIIIQMSLITLRDQYVIPAIDRHQFDHGNTLHSSLDENGDLEAIKKSIQKQKKLQVFLEAVNNGISGTAVGDEEIIKALFEVAGKSEDDGGFGLGITYEVRTVTGKSDHNKPTNMQQMLLKMQKQNPKKKVAPATSSSSELTPVPAGMTLKQFFSKSADQVDLASQPKNWRKILSNFNEVPGGFSYNDKSYHTVEHYFQAMKLNYSDHPEKALEYEIGNTIGNADPTVAKSSGNKTSYKKQNITLDEDEWNKNKDNVMMDGLNARLQADEDFKNILRATKAQKYYLLHYERSGENSYWGGVDNKDGNIKGQNTLGKMLMKLRDSIPLPPRKKAKLKPKKAPVPGTPPPPTGGRGTESAIIIEVKKAIAFKESQGEPLSEQVSSTKSLASIIQNPTEEHVRIHRALKNGTIN
jgi:ribA/ribD-fused uncharacterized protein